MYQYQFAQWHIFCFSRIQRSCISSLRSRFYCLPLCYLRTHLQEFLLCHTRLSRIFCNHCQTQFLQFLLLKISSILCALCLISSHHISSQRCRWHNLLLYRHRRQCSIHICQTNIILLSTFHRYHFLRKSQHSLILDRR